MKIAIMGTGGLGGYIGERLANAGREVVFIARGKHLKAIQKHGLRVESPLGNFKIKSANATYDPEDIGVVDLILFCVKTYDALDAVKLMKPMIGPNTTILPVLNAVDHIDLLTDLCGSTHVLGGVAVLVSNICEPGVIKHLALNSLVFGEISGGVSPRSKQLQKILAVDGIHVEVVSNIMVQMWTKFASICGLGIFTVMRGDKEKIFGYESTRSMIHQAIIEVVQVAQAKGIPLSASIADNVLSTISNNTPPTYKPSSLVDLERGNRLEIEALNGALSRYGKEMGISTPINDFIYACLKPFAGESK